MTDKNVWNMTETHNRRQFLRRTAAGGFGAGTILTAGCLGDDPTDDDTVDEGDDTDDPEPEFPSDRFNVIIPWGQGGGTDIFTRQIWYWIHLVGFRKRDIMYSLPIKWSKPSLVLSQLYSIDDTGHSPE